jgi:hypothetical protein
MKCLCVGNFAFDDHRIEKTMISKAKPFQKEKHFKSAHVPQKCKIPPFTHIP